MVFGYILGIKIVLMNNVYLESFILWLFETKVSLLQEVDVLLKWNNSKSLGEGLSYQ